MNKNICLGFISIAMFCAYFMISKNEPLSIVHNDKADKAKHHNELSIIEPVIKVISIESSHNKQQSLLTHEIKNKNADENMADLDINESLDILEDLVNNDIKTLTGIYAAEKLRQKILNDVNGNPNNLDNLLDYYQSNTSSHMGELIFSIFEQIKSPKIEGLGFELANAEEKGEIERGLRLLASQDLNHSGLLDTTSSILRRNSDDVNIVTSALDIMPRIPVEQHRSQDIIDTLTSLSTHEDAEIRSTSLMKLGQWARSMTDLEPLISALDTDERFSAAHALYKSHITSKELRNELFSRMTSEQEPMELRQIAAETLKRFLLEDAQVANYQSFMRQHDTQSLFE